MGYGCPKKTPRIQIIIFHDQNCFDWSFTLFYSVFKLYFLRMKIFLLYENFETLKFGHDFGSFFCTCKEIYFFIILNFGDFWYKVICVLKLLLLDSGQSLMSLSINLFLLKNTKEQQHYLSWKMSFLEKILIGTNNIKNQIWHGESQLVSVREIFQDLYELEKCDYSRKQISARSSCARL